MGCFLLWESYAQGILEEKWICVDPVFTKQDDSKAHTERQVETRLGFCNLLQTMQKQMEVFALVSWQAAVSDWPVWMPQR